MYCVYRVFTQQTLFPKVYSLFFVKQYRQMKIYNIKLTMHPFASFGAGQKHIFEVTPVDRLLNIYLFRSICFCYDIIFEQEQFRCS